MGKGGNWILRKNNGEVGKIYWGRPRKKRKTTESTESKHQKQEIEKRVLPLNKGKVIPSSQKD